MLRGKGGGEFLSGCRLSGCVSACAFVCVTRGERHRRLAATAYGGQPSADASSTSAARRRECRRRQKFLPQRLGPSLRPEKRRRSSLPPSRGRLVAAVAVR